MSRLDSKEFETFLQEARLEQFPRRKCRYCPLAAWLSHLYKREVHVTKGSYYIGNSGIPHRLPFWARSFVHTYDNTILTPLEALREVIRR